MLNRVITPESVKVVDMGLTNKCNLRCPLCTYTVKEKFKDATMNLKSSDLIDFLNKLPNIQIAIIEGNYSEPTLYPDLPLVIKYLKQRNIRIRLSTNGSTRDEEYWRNEIGPLMTGDDVVRFSIDGSTQEIYELYRVGGSLKKVLENHKALKSNSKAITVLQNVIFQYNDKDRENVKKMFFDEGFDYLSHLKCYSTAGRDHHFFKPIEAIDRYHKTYNKSVSDIKKPTLICDSYRRNEIYINHRGQVFLCGTLEEDKVYEDKPFVTDDLKKIFEDITFTANNIYNNPICKTDCNLFGYTVGEQYPDVLIDRNNNVKLMNYFNRELPEELCTINQLL